MIINKESKTLNSDALINLYDKEIRFKKSHLFSYIITVAVVSSAGFYSISNTLEEKEKVLKASIMQNKILENENQKYDTELEQLKFKAETLEVKLKELEKVKEDITNKLLDIEAEAQEKVSQIQPEEDTESTVVASISTEEKVTPVLETLDKIETDMFAEEIEFVYIADNITERLAAVREAKMTPAGIPVNGVISSNYSFRNDPINNSESFHSGIDIAVKEGTPVKATASGTVIQSRYINGYGYAVEIDHGNGYSTLYAHNSELLVNVSDNIEKGDVIALSGATGRVTGPHVHYEVKFNGEVLNPRDFM